MRKLKQGEAIGIAIAVPVVVFFFIIIQAFGPYSAPGTGTSLGSVVDTDGGIGELVIEDIVVGDGEEIQQGQLISVHYVGTLADGTVFDSSRDRETPFQYIFGAGQVILGWERGLTGMRVGGQRTLVIPPELAYGDRGIGIISGGATLFFEVELLGAENI